MKLSAQETQQKQDLFCGVYMYRLKLNPLAEINTD